MPFELTEGMVRDYASTESFARGEDYYQQDAVLSLTRRGNALQAEVAGSEFSPYLVRVNFDKSGVAGAECNCLYEWGGWCKHIVAVLLASIREPESVRERPALEDVLSSLDRDLLQTILLKLAGRDPSLAEVIESEISLSAPSEDRPVDTDSIRRRVRSSLGRGGYLDPYEDYGYVGGDVDEASRILDDAWNLIRAGDARRALPILDAITAGTEEAREMLEWEMMDDYGGEILDFFEALGAAWTEALLSVDLTPHQQEDYGAKLDVWWGELADYDAGESFGAAFQAVEQGWSYPPLLRILNGEAPEEEDEVFERYDPLTAARLNVLERRGRHEEYLRLAEAAEETTSHAVMLARLGRTWEAVEYGLERLHSPQEVLAVAEALRDQGSPEEALRMGEHGLSLEGRKGPLAIWTRDLAEETGHPTTALEAGVAAFQENQDLTSYRRVRELSGGDWLECRERLLDDLRMNVPYYPRGHVEVFLHEGLIGDAIEVVEESPSDALVDEVVDAAVETHPGWVIRTCRDRAEEIMDSGASKYYDEAVRWLAKARDASLSDGRDEEWQDYLDELVSQHQRKYKLRPMLEGLGER